MVAVAGHYFCDPGDQHRRVASSVLSSELNNHKLNETYRPTCAFSDLKQRPVHADMFQTWAVCYGYDPFLPVSQTGVVATPLSAALKINRDEVTKPGLEPTSHPQRAGLLIMVRVIFVCCNHPLNLVPHRRFELLHLRSKRSTTTNYVSGA
jgi:hypothetical protein